jgi:hypothetical protein
LIGRPGVNISTKLAVLRPETNNSNHLKTPVRSNRPFRDPYILAYFKPFRYFQLYFNSAGFPELDNMSTWRMAIEFDFSSSIDGWRWSEIEFNTIIS